MFFLSGAALAAGSEATVTILPLSGVSVKLSVSADGRGLVYPLEARKKSGPFSFSAGSHRFSVRFDDTVLKESTRTLTKGGRYLMIVTGPAGSVDVTWVKLGTGATKTGAKVRIVNLAPDLPSLDVHRGADTIASGVRYGKASRIVTLSPGALVVEAFRSETGEKLGVLDSQSLEAGQAYTLLVFGAPSKPESMWIVER